MNQTKSVNSLLLALILLVHTWIGISVSHLAVHSAVAPSAPSESEHLIQTLASLDRLVERLHPTTVGSARLDRPTNAEFANGDSRGEVRAEMARQSSVETRTHLPIPPPPERVTLEPRRSERYYYDLAERIAPKVAADNLRGIHVRMRSSGKAARRTTRQSVLLMTRSMVLSSFGKPDQISLTQSGHESWQWDNSVNRRVLSIVFRDGYAINVH